MSGRAAPRRSRLAALAVCTVLAAGGPAGADCTTELAQAGNDLLCGRYREAITKADNCLAADPAVQEEILARTLIVEARAGMPDDLEPDAEPTVGSAVEAWNTLIEDVVSSCVLQTDPQVHLFSGLDDGRVLATRAARAMAFSTCFSYSETECLHELGQAVRHYVDGQWERVADVLRPCLTLQTRLQNRVAAYALLAMSYLALDDRGRASSAIQRLVRLDRGYDPELDAIFVPAGPELRREFVQLVEQARSRGVRSVEDVLGIDGCLGSFELCPLPQGRCLPDPPTERWDIGIQAGFFLPDGYFSGKSEAFSQSEPLVGLTAGWMLRERWGLFADVTWSDINTNLEAEDSDTLTIGLEAKRLFRQHAWNASSPDSNAFAWRWLVSFGAGWSHYGLESSPSVDRTLASVAFGQRWQLDRHARLRWELGLEQTLDHEGFQGEGLTSVQLLVNLTWAIHGNRRAD